MLFETPLNLDLKDATLVYYSNFFSKKKSDFYFSDLIKTIKWQHDSITVFGKSYLQPRLTAFFASNNKPYKYSNITMTPSPFKNSLLEIKKTVEKKQRTEFTSCLANLYRDGQDSNGWHADNEKELGHTPLIASVSLGSERVFKLKHRYDKTRKASIVLEHGSLLIMKGNTQKYWLHQIPKTKKPIGPRINLTFRIIA
ncbi:alpha-ketoglutarate-dependent dioxygenase AlkB family protein [Cognatitamlana onchidii]|uniref:alpha-ketoglutarate-dependent dioxygenase AlkB family protein n=1 Tax=Cognatitamlana onchidii TaxID=2562860 RepID=UPI0010A641B4|nr:alpha-ketoglutarate-dependent dioxygenase AlkB [Algibacter onchidii]